MFTRVIQKDNCFHLLHDVLHDILHDVFHYVLLFFQIFSYKMKNKLNM